MSEAITEGIFRNFYGSTTFIEKADIPKEYGFKSKNDTGESGYPDFFKEFDDYVIVVEAKANDFELACEQVKFYIENNDKPNVDMIGIAISGQSENSYKASVSIRLSGKDYKVLLQKGKLQTLTAIKSLYIKEKYPEKISEDSLKLTLENLNKTFHNDMKIKDTYRSLFFSGLMIALCDGTFIDTYKSIKTPSEDEIKTRKWFKCHKLNDAIVNAIDNQISNKINNLSKEYNWKDVFSFIKTIDYDLNEYKSVISNIEEYIFLPFKFDEKLDILGKAYKIFLSQAGKIDNKNIILTPDHIKEVMVELAQLEVSDVLIDTCTGSGGFLMEGMETMIKQAGNDLSIINNIKENQLIGFEIDPTLFALACTNMFLHGDGRTNMIYHDSIIGEDRFATIFHDIIDRKPTKCIINPPYENNQSILFVETALNLLVPNGRLIIIMPTPTLNKNKEKTLEILENAHLDFVIKMPDNLFSEQRRSVNTSIFGFTKRKHNKSEMDKVLFYNMDDDGLVSVQHKGRIDKNGKWKNIIRPKLIECLNSTPQILNEYSEYRPIFKNVVGGNFDFNPYGFRDISSNANFVRFGDLFDFGRNNNGVKGSLAASEGTPDGDYDFITAAEDWKTSNTFDYESGDECLVYVVSSAGSLGRCHYVKGEKPYIVSNLCLVLKPKNTYPVNLQFYSLYLNSIRKVVVDEIADGTSKLTLSPSELSEYEIEYFDIDYQNQKAKEYEDNVLALKVQLENALKNFKI